jgi:hypothetical protein
MEPPVTHATAVNAAPYTGWNVGKASMGTGTHVRSLQRSGDGASPEAGDVAKITPEPPEERFGPAMDRTQ